MKKLSLVSGIEIIKAFHKAGFIVTKLLAKK